MLMLCCVIVMHPARAEAVSIIRDTEIEATLQDYARPLLNAAGLAEEGVQIIIVGDPSLNAFVANGANLYIHTGLLLAAEQPDVIIGVIAHELGHIKGGHLIRTHSAMKNMQVTYGLAAVLAAAAAAAGSGDASSGLLTLGSGLAQTQFLTYSRAQEQAADQAGLSYLDSTGISAHGLQDMLTIIRQKERLSPDMNMAFLRTHPLTQERMAHVRYHAETQDIPRFSDDHPLVEKHARMRAKLFAFLEKPTASFRRFEKDTSLAGRMGMAIAHFRNAETDESLDIMNTLIAEHPDDPYLHELKGQIAFESAHVEEAAKAYGQANTLLRARDQQAPLVTLDYARALFTRGTAEDLQEAEGLLERVTRVEPDNVLAWRTLASIYNKRDKAGLYNMAKAEAALLQLRFKDAIALGERALSSLPEESGPARLRTQDLIALARRKQKEEDDG